MPIAMNHSVPMGAYGTTLANAAQQEQYGAMLNPYIKQFFEQEYQSGEAVRNRDWRTGERLGQQDWQSGEAARNRDWQTGERLGQQDWQTGERLGQQDWRTGERLGQQGWQTGERLGQQGWQTGESALDRELQRWQTQYLNPRTTSFTFRGPYTGPGSFADRANRIHLTHFGD